MFLRLSEVDVTTWMNKKGPTTPRSLAMQADAFARTAAVAMLLENSGHYNIWGVGGSLSTSSIGKDDRLQRRSNAPFDENYQRRPAYPALRAAVKNPQSVVRR